MPERGQQKEREREMELKSSDTSPDEPSTTLPHTWDQTHTHCDLDKWDGCVYLKHESVSYLASPSLWTLSLIVTRTDTKAP